MKRGPIFTHTISHVNPQIIPQYDSPQQFEPLMPAEPLLAPLLEKAGDLHEFRAMLSAAFGDLDADNVLATTLGQAFAAAQAAGRSDLSDESH